MCTSPENSRSNPLQTSGPKLATASGQTLPVDSPLLAEMSGVRFRRRAPENLTTTTIHDFHDDRESALERRSARTSGTGGRMVSEAWRFFKKAQGGAECQIDGCKNVFVKRANGSSTKFLWSHLDHHHKEVSKELRSQFGRGMPIKWTRQKNKLANSGNTLDVTETVNVHCLSSSNGSGHLHENVQYEYEHDELHNLNAEVDDQPGSGMSLNLMQLLPSNSNGGSEKADTLVGSGGNGELRSSAQAVNEYFGKMVVAQLNQMDERQAHQTRERIQVLVGEVLYASSNEPTHFNEDQFNH